MGTLLREPKLEVFYTPPRHDLKLNIDLELREEEQDEERPWPDSGLLYGEDPDYQHLIQDIMELVGNGVEEIHEYSNVRYLPISVFILRSWVLVLQCI